MSTEEVEEDYSHLSLDDRLNHKLWKVRLNAYKELNDNFITYPNDNSNDIYWNDPNLFNKFILDSNVVSQEQAILALNSFLNNNTKSIISKTSNSTINNQLSLWLPSLAEKGLTSTRSITKDNSQICILKLISFDNSILDSIELLLPLLIKKLPKLLVSTLFIINKIILSFNFININGNLFNDLLVKLIENLPKLASHADKNVRLQSMTLIATIYQNNLIETHNYKILLQELLIEKLKPIQQRDLEKLISSNNKNDDNEILKFQWQIKEEAIDNNNKDSNIKVDEDGDTIMGMEEIVQPIEKNDFNPSALLPEQTILDKLPENFNERINSNIWKDRVEVLQELYDTTLISIKKLKSNNQDYSTLLTTLSHIVNKDANVQAVTIASQSIQIILEKLQLTNLPKNYITIVFMPLLERTKEKKPSVIDSIKKTLITIVKFFNPIDLNNEDLLQDILKFMNNKIPQTKFEVTSLFDHILLQNFNNPKAKKILLNYINNDELIQSMIKIVNDTQPNIRNIGFESFAHLIKIMGNQPAINESLDKIDKMKKKKVMDLVQKLPSPEMKANINGSSTTSTNNNNKQSVLPAKRGPSSPLKKSNNKISTTPPKSRGLLTSRSLVMPKANENKIQSPKLQKSQVMDTKSQNELDHLRLEKQIWEKDMHDLKNKTNSIINEKNQLFTENESLKKQLKLSQTQYHDINLQLRSKDLQLNKLQDKVKQLEEQGSNNHFSRPPSAHIENNNLISTRSSTFNSNIDHKRSNVLSSDSKLERRQSASSDDLPNRVNSLQLNTNINDTFLNEESWKRAARVTALLKERIEKMRDKSRDSDI